uniref:Neurexin-4 n=1 Tax=Angiostrongylus cantonensis TaxID=6313 RepID=A0A158P8K2_ANGCA
MVVYSTLSHNPSWNHVDFFASKLRIKNAYGLEEVDTHNPLLMLTICDIESPITVFDDTPYVVDTHRAGLVSMYENELVVLFRSYRSGVLFFSVADQGDILIAQLLHGTVHVMFDFGSLAPSHISAGRALDDGRWHEFRWLHQFDSIQLTVDGVILNQTTPIGLYRKLDFHNQIHIGGRPPDEFSEGIETSFTGCVARLQLNSVNLLNFAPSGGGQKCQMPKPPSLTLHESARAVIPFTFLPFSFEFRILPVPSLLLDMLDADNLTLLQTTVDEEKTLHLVSNVSRFKQIANPLINVADGGWHSFLLRIRGPRLEVEIDGYTVLWLEGQEVRRISARLSSLVLSSVGCYRSTTVDFDKVHAEGTVIRGGCEMVDRCQPSRCENDGVCHQTTLFDYKCICTKGHYGKNCHSSNLPRSCEEWWSSRGNRTRLPLAGKNVTIDLDGGGPMKPLLVTCMMVKDDMGFDVINTVLQHDLKRPIYVTGDTNPGVVRKQLVYGVSTEQMDRLVEGFETCSQYMRFSCRGGARLMTQGEDRSPSSWYSTRSEKHGLQWGDAPPYSRMCSCATNGTCLHNRMCNCDSGEDATDEGVNSYSQLLPVTGLFLGGTTKSSSIEVEIGPLICNRRISFEPITFSDRNSRLTSVRILSVKTFDIFLQAKFRHPHMSLFSWESIDSLHWLHLYIQDGKIIGEIVNGGETLQVMTDSIYNDGLWHSIYWEADTQGMRLRVDGRTSETNATTLILPSAHQWTIGSRTERGLSGFAGVIRSVYLCGEELQLSTVARRDYNKGVHIGDEGHCREGLCKNGGVCLDKYDGYACDCSGTPFGGDDCSKEYSMFVPMGSSLQIPWQNPAHTSTCHRIAIQTTTTNVSILKSKALFAESTFNMSIEAQGHLSISVYDGFSLHHNNSEERWNLSDNIMHDIEFCASNSSFNLTVGFYSTFISGNWSFFQNFNVWTFLDKNYTGCVSRMRVGSSFPLKNPKAARLKYSGKIRFGSCSVDVIDARTYASFSDYRQPSTRIPDDEEIHIHAVVHAKHHIISLTSIIGLAVAGVLALLLSILVCYMRSRPEGVYKTNEGEYSPSRSEEPLVNGIPVGGKEYFC